MRTLRRLWLMGGLLVLLAAADPALAFYRDCYGYILVTNGGMDCYERCDFYTDGGAYVGRSIKKLC